MNTIDLSTKHNVIEVYHHENYKQISEKYKDPATNYAFAVLNETVLTGYMMKLAAFRHLQDLRRTEEHQSDFPYVFDVSKENGLLSFAAMCPDVETEKPIQLMPWEQFIMGQLTGWRDENGDKRFVDNDISIARAQGKTYVASIDLCYSFLLEAMNLSNQDFLAAANTTDQIDKLFSYVSFMMRRLIDEHEIFGRIAKQNDIQIQSNRIIAKETKNRLVRVSNESGKFDGYHFMNAVYDEAGDEKAGQNTSRITTGQNNVANHQFTKISSAYEFLDTEFHHGLERGQQVMEQDFNRDLDNRLWLGWSQDDVNETYEPKMWGKSNPLLDNESQHDRLLKGLISSREGMEADGKLREFQNRSLNMYLQTQASAFIKLDDLNRSVVPEDSFNIIGREVYIGYDYSLMSDNTAFGFVFPYIDGDKQKFHIIQHSFIPWYHAGSIQSKEEQDGVNYRLEADRGHCTITAHPEGLINPDQVLHWILEFVETNKLKVMDFQYDRFGVDKVIKALESNSGWPLQDVRQIASEMSAPTKFMQKLFVEGSVTRFDDEIQRRAFLNAQLKENKAGIEIDKDKATYKIDVVDATDTAFFQGMYHFDDFSDANDPSQQVDRMTEEQVLEWFKSQQSGLSGGDVDDI